MRLPRTTRIRRRHVCCESSDFAGLAVDTFAVQGTKALNPKPGSKHGFRGCREIGPHLVARPSLDFLSTSRVGLLQPTLITITSLFLQVLSYKNIGHVGFV